MYWVSQPVTGEIVKLVSYMFGYLDGELSFLVSQLPNERGDRLSSLLDRAQPQTCHIGWQTIESVEDRKFLTVAS
jgi:hypothetical protein